VPVCVLIIIHPPVPPNSAHRRAEALAGQLKGVTTRLSPTQPSELVTGYGSVKPSAALGPHTLRRPVGGPLPPKPPARPSPKGRSILRIFLSMGSTPKGPHRDGAQWARPIGGSRPPLPSSLTVPVYRCWVFTPRSAQCPASRTKVGQADLKVTRGQPPRLQAGCEAAPRQLVELTTLNKGSRLAGDGMYTGEKDPFSIPLGPYGRPSLWEPDSQLKLSEPRHCIYKYIQYNIDREI